MANPAQASAQGHEVVFHSGPKVLTPEELDRYHRDGFLVPKFRLSSEEVRRLQALLSKLVADNPDKIDFVLSSPHIPRVGGIKSGDAWMEFATHPVIVDMIEQIIGPDIILRSTNVFYKRPGKGPPTPWHRDAFGKADTITPLESTAVWIAGSDTCKDNACLRFIPGSHKSRTGGTHRQDTVLCAPVLEESEYDESTAVDIEVEAGQMVIFDIFTIHGSWPNLGTRERAAFTSRFMPGTSHFDHDTKRPPHLQNPTRLDISDRALILVRGVDRAGNDFQRAHPKKNN